VPIACSPGDSCAKDEHPGRRHYPRRRHEQREKARQGGGRQNHSAVPGDSAHRRERIHILSAGDARNGIHAETRDAPVAELPDQIERQQRLQEADDHCVFTQGRDIHGGGVLHMHENIGRSTESEAVSGDNGADFLIGRVRVTGSLTSTCLNGDGYPAANQGRHDLGCERHPPFARHLFARYPDLHWPISSQSLVSHRAHATVAPPVSIGQQKK